MGFPDDGLAEDADDDFDVDCRSSFATCPVFAVPREGDGEGVGQPEVVDGVTVGLDLTNGSLGLGDGVRVMDIRVTIASEKEYKREDRNRQVIIIEVFCSRYIFLESVQIGWG